MPLTLSDDELDDLENALATLLSPSAYGSIVSWRQAVGSTIRRLLCASEVGVTTVAPGDGGLVVSITGRICSPAALADYVAHYHHQNDGDRIRLARGLGTWTRMQLTPRSELCRTAYFNDWARPNGVIDSAGMSVTLPAQWGGEAVVHVADQSADRFEPGGREHALLGLLRPAFDAGVRAALAALSWKNDLARELDRLGAALVLCEPSGRVVHVTPYLLDRIDGDPAGKRVLAAAGRLARDVGALLQGGARRATGTPPLPACSCQGATWRYQLRATLVESPELLGAAPLVLISVDLPSSAQAPIRKELMVQHGLTGREADVALLLRRGQRNRQIAAELGITEHTARRHTERILQKLGVESRAAVAEMLTRQVR